MFFILKIYLEPDRTKLTQHQESILSYIINRFRRLGNYFHSEPALSVISSSSTPYFAFVLWSFVAIKVYQFYWYLIPISIFIIIYKSIKCFFLHIYTYFSRQERIKCIIQQIIAFWKVR